MPFIIRIYYNNRIYSIDLSRVENATIGSDNSDTITLNAYGLGKSHVKIANIKNKTVIKSKGMYDSFNRKISSDQIEIGKKYVLRTEPEITLAVHPKQGDSCKALGLTGVNEITLGRSHDNDIVLANPRTSSKHCTIYWDNGVLKVRDLRSTNGTFVNGARILEKTLSNGDIINISIYQLIIKNNLLYFYNTGNDLIVNVKQRSENIFQEKKKSGTFDAYDEQMVHGKGGTMSAFDVNIKVNIEER